MSRIQVRGDALIIDHGQGQGVVTAIRRGSLDSCTAVEDLVTMHSAARVITVDEATDEEREIVTAFIAGEHLVDVAVKGEKTAAEDALDGIATACGCPHWDYPAQIVRDVAALAFAHTKAEADVVRLTAALQAATRLADEQRARAEEIRQLADANLANHDRVAAGLVDTIATLRKERDDARAELTAALAFAHTKAEADVVRLTAALQAATRLADEQRARAEEIRQLADANLANHDRVAAGLVDTIATLRKERDDARAELTAYHVAEAKDEAAIRADERRRALTEAADAVDAIARSMKKSAEGGSLDDFFTHFVHGAAEGMRTIGADLRCNAETSNAEGGEHSEARPSVDSSGDGATPSCAAATAAEIKAWVRILELCLEHFSGLTDEDAETLQGLRDRLREPPVEWVDGKATVGGVELVYEEMQHSSYCVSLITGAGFGDGYGLVRYNDPDTAKRIAVAAAREIGRAT